MPLYGVPQAGGVLSSVIPGEGYTLFSGAETPVLNLRSVAFSRGPSDSMGDNGISFFASGMPTGMTIDIQAANADVAGDYLTVGTLAPDANGNAAYTDIGRAAFYCAVISAFTSGAMPIVTAQR